MEHDVTFLRVLFDFASGETKKSTSLRNFLDDNPPPPNDMLWALNVFREGAGESPVNTLQNVNFVEEMVRLVDKLDKQTKHADGITVQGKTDYRSDQGMNIQNRNALGMKSYQDIDVPERSAGSLLYEALFTQGWRSLNSSFKGLGITKPNSPKNINMIREIAKEEGLENDICFFKMGTANYTMLSPALQNALSSRVVSETLYPMQEGERPQSLVRNSGSKNFPTLVSLVQQKLRDDGVNPDIAIVKRKRDGGGANPTCYTALFQNALLEFGIIPSIPDTSLKSITVRDAIIPTDIAALEELATQICAFLKGKASEYSPPHPSSGFTFQSFQSGASSNSISSIC